MVKIKAFLEIEVELDENHSYYSGSTYSEMSYQAMGGLRVDLEKEISYDHKKLKITNFDYELSIKGKVNVK